VLRGIEGVEVEANVAPDASLRAQASEVVPHSTASSRDRSSLNRCVMVNREELAPKEKIVGSACSSENEDRRTTASK
jgi:hypothetical protein